MAYKHFPEIRAGGFSRRDGTVAFYSRVRSLVSADSVVVDFGAGRGRYLEDDVLFRRDLQRLKGTVRHVIGLDVDDAVRQNCSVDEAHVIDPSRSLPVEDDTADVIISDYVFEHIEDPSWTGRELTRILKPGGWICARTPNKWGMISISARLVPNSFHDTLLRYLQPQKKSVDTFPTVYRLNTRAQLERHFAPTAFDHCTFTYDGGPSYAGNSRIAWKLSRGAARLTPSRFDPMLFVFMQKKLGIEATTQGGRDGRTDSRRIQ